jgi:hypothetical protein
LDNELVTGPTAGEISDKRGGIKVVVVMVGGGGGSSSETSDIPDNLFLTIKRFGKLSMEKSSDMVESRFSMLLPTTARGAKKVDF